MSIDPAPRISPPENASHSDIKEPFVAMLLGVSGTGKTTLGEMLAPRMDAYFYDADDFHSEAAVAKMRAGHSLTDADRVPWLDRIQKAVHRWRRTERRIIFAVSGLRKIYRRVMSEELPASKILYESTGQSRSSEEGEKERITQATLPNSSASSSSPPPSPLYMFLLHGDFNLLLQRINARKGHYFPPSLLQSQFDTLEMPGDDEDVMVVDVSMEKEEIVEVIAHAIVKRHKGGEVGSHVQSSVTQNSVNELLKEPVPVKLSVV